MAEVFAARGASVLVFRGDDGLDELTTTDHHHGLGGRGGEVRARRSTRRRSACRVATREDLRGGDAADNAGGRPGACSRASAGRCATRCCSTPRPRWPPPTAAAAGPAADLAARRRGAARAASTRSTPARRRRAGPPGWRFQRDARLGAHPERPAAVRLEADGEGGVGVAPRVAAERDVGVGVQHAGHLDEPPGTSSASSSWSATRTIATRSTSPAQE